MKLYLAGPMRGIPYFNFPEFDRYAEMLRSKGFEVVNPADIDREGGHEPDPSGDIANTTLDFNECMARDLAAVCLCDGIFLMPGWYNSQGARIELSVATALHKMVYLHNSHPLGLYPH